MANPIRKQIARAIPLFFWMALIFYVSHQPKTDLPTFGVLNLLVNKGAHVVGYAIFYLLALFAFGKPKWALLLSVLFAISDEYHQTFVPGRMGRWYDVVIDSLGALTAYIWSVKKWYRQRQSVAN